MLHGRTGEQIPPFVFTKLISEEQLPGGQLQKLDIEMKRIEANQEAIREQITPEQLLNIRKEKDRIHAKKTRLRKKIASDEAKHVCFHFISFI
jgi:hypothetical protein